MPMPELGITINTSTIPAGIADLDKIAPAAARAEQAVTKLTQTTTQQLQQAGNSATEYANKIDQAMQRQSGAGASFGGIDIAKMQAAMPGIEKLGRELDSLRMKYVPLAAAEAQHAAALDEIHRAHMLGALSAAEMTAAIDKQTAAMARQRAAAAAQGGAANDPMKRMNQTNMMYQFQDIAVTAAMGMDPAMIALQQGSQMAMNFQGAGGVGAGLKGMASGLMAMVAPATLLPMLIVGVGAAMYQWLTGSGEKVKTLDETVKEHTKSVNELAKAYGYAGVNAGDMADKSLAAMEALERANRAALKEKIFGTGAELLGMKGEGGFMDAIFGGGALDVGKLAGQQAGGGFHANREFKAFEEPITYLAGQLGGGIIPDMEKFDALVTKIAEGEGLAKPGEDIFRLTQPLREAIALLGVTNEKLAEQAILLNKLKIAQADAVTDEERLKAAKDLFEAQNKNAKVNLELETMTAQIERENHKFRQDKEQTAKTTLETAQNELNIMGETATRQEVLRQKFQAIQDVKSEMARRGIEEGDKEYAGYMKTIGLLRQAYEWLLKIKEAQDDVTRANKEAAFAAEIAGMNARTNAERIAAAANTAGAGKVAGPDTDQEVDHARRRTAAQIEKEMADATRSRHEALDDLVASAQLELEIMGKTTSEQQALR
jgi:hypothetical protein